MWSYHIYCRHEILQVSHWPSTCRLFHDFHGAVRAVHWIEVDDSSSCNLPSGYFSRSYREITTFNGKIHYQWPFSIAMLIYQRVLSTDFYQWLSLSLQHPYSILVTSDGWALDPNLHAIISLKQTKRHRKPQRHRFSHEIKNIRTAGQLNMSSIWAQFVPALPNGSFFLLCVFFGSEFCLDVDGVLIRGGSAQEANPPPIQGHSHWILSQDVSTICGYVPPKCLDIFMTKRHPFFGQSHGFTRPPGITCASTPCRAPWALFPHWPAWLWYDHLREQSLLAAPTSSQDIHKTFTREIR